MADKIKIGQLDDIEEKVDQILDLLDGRDDDEPDEPDTDEPDDEDEEDDEEEPTEPGTSGKHPSQVLPLLRWWTIMLPTGGQGDPDNLYLVDKSIEDVYFVNAAGEVVFECPADGVHSPNSKYARSEARQMVSGKEWAKSAWPSSERHELSGELAIDMSGLTGERPRINSLQIHDGGDDVMQVQYREDGSLGVSHDDGDSWEVLDPAYPNGAFFTCRITVAANTITVAYARGGVAKTVGIPKKGSGWYWKAGAYLNTGGASEFEQPAGARGRVTFRKLDASPA